MRKNNFLFLNSLIWPAIIFSLQASPSANSSQLINDIENQVENLEEQHGTFAEVLIEPVTALAKLYLHQNQLDKATNELRKAQNLAHRNHGVYTPKQDETIAMLADIAIKKKDYRAANTQHEFAFFVQSHHLSPKDPEILFAYSKMANWYMQTGQPQRSLQLLEAAIKEANNLDTDPLPFAIDRSRARRLGGICCVSKELLAMVKDSSKSDPETLAKAYLELADTYILSGKETIAAEYFLKASEINPSTLSVAPYPISAKKLVSGPQAQMFQRKNIYRQENNLYSRRHLIQSSHNDLIEDMNLEPSWFIVDSEDTHQHFIMPDRNTRAPKRKNTDELVGNPILFSSKQLETLISPQLKNKREELKLEFTFTVTKKGKLKDIKLINSTAPVKLNRLITNSLKKFHYRPRLVNGRPTKTENVQFMQTFPFDNQGAS